MSTAHERAVFQLGDTARERHLFQRSAADEGVCAYARDGIGDSELLNVVAVLEGVVGYRCYRVAVAELRYLGDNRGRVARGYRVGAVDELIGEVSVAQLLAEVV